MDFGLVGLAVEMFDQMPERNCFSYNALMAGFCRNGEGLRALELFMRMVEEGMELIEFTLTSVIGACGLLMAFHFACLYFKRSKKIAQGQKEDSSGRLEPIGTKPIGFITNLYCI
ncbi:putative pentatricopeptide [Rosa chinensis]|uniref:Putative pentatricopeptide n=1 Tax=Rosa chinensis TaxID=74649 RepID=A0A2P6SNL4_ROSCH|nr:putative pentatricopeptide [Rosa chinensis]